jgi:hypothetical protein
MPNNQQLFLGCFPFLYSKNYPVALQNWHQQDLQQQQMILWHNIHQEDSQVYH